MIDSRHAPGPIPARSILRDLRDTPQQYSQAGHLGSRISMRRSANAWRDHDEIRENVPFTRVGLAYQYSRRTPALRAGWNGVDFPGTTDSRRLELICELDARAIGRSPACVARLRACSPPLRRAELADRARTS